MLLTVEQEKQAIKDYYNQLIKLGKKQLGKFFYEKTIQKKYPQVYKIFSSSNDNIDEFIYDIIFDNIEKPKCLVCEKPNKFRSYNDGYTTYCSKECTDKHAFSSLDFKQKISDGMKRKYDSEYYKEKYKNVILKDGENFLISDYCNHGDFYINKNKYERLINENANLCQICANDNNLLEDVDYLLGKFLNEESYKLRYPSMYNTIIANCKENDASFSEKRYMELNKIHTRPKCPICNIRKVKYIDAFSGYTKSCANYSCVSSSSQQERDLSKFINDLGVLVINRKKIENNELDIYIPLSNIGIEYNGLFWHSEKQGKHSKWHLNKADFFKTQNIQLITIWEDDWLFKPEIVKSIIINKLGKSNRIFARKCTIKEVSSEASGNFLNKNHLQGRCNDSIRYGLYYKDELVSLMTFGRKRMILNSLSEENNWELLRFCNKLNFSVIGGASKLFNHFKKNHNFINMISYANRDISDGKLYENLNFKFIKKTAPGYWWCKDNHKHHRSNFMKHKIVEKSNYNKTTESKEMIKRGYFKVWNAGNLKYIYTNNK